MPDGVTVLLTGEQAVPDKVHGGDSLILYVEGAEAVQAFKRANRFVGSQAGTFRAHLELRNKFWDAGNENLPVINYRQYSVACAPELFVAADLSCISDSRLREVADQMIRGMERS